MQPGRIALPLAALAMVGLALASGCGSAPGSVTVTQEPVQKPVDLDLSQSGSDRYGPPGGSPPEPSARVESIEIYANYFNGVRIGRTETLPLRAIVTFADDSPTQTVDVEWTASDVNTFTVRATAATKCEIRGVEVGTAHLTATAAGVSSEPLDIIVQKGPIIPPTP